MFADSDSSHRTIIRFGSFDRAMAGIGTRAVPPAVCAVLPWVILCAKLEFDLKFIRFSHAYGRSVI